MTTCRFPDCGRPVHTRKLGLCYSHCDQHYRREPLRPIRTPVDLTEVEHLASCGEPEREIARRLGVTVGAIARAYYRAGQPDAARPFERVARQDRRWKVAALRSAA